MSRSRRLFLAGGMAAAHTVLIGSLLNPSLLSAQTGIPPEVRDACMADVQRLCANVPPGGGRIIACLKQHQQDVSDRCKQAIVTALQQSRGGGAGGAVSALSAPALAAPAPSSPISPAGTGSTTVAPPAPVHALAGHPTTVTATGPGERYFLMKQVKIIDQALGQGRPAYDLMIPAACRPSATATFELSNQFDHAWLNGTNEYVMSDDPTFSPSGNLTGSWTELQVVR